MTIALECLARRKFCFLEHLDWKNVPWALEPGSKTPILFLQDILCSVPGLMEDAATLQNLNLIPKQFLVLHQMLSDKIEAHLAELYAWRAAWEEANPHSCYEVPNPTILEDQEPLFPTTLHFRTLTTANEVTTYNAILLLLYRLGFEIIGPSFNVNSSSLLPISFRMVSNNPLYLPGHAPSSQAIATEICRSAEYHLLGNQSSAGAFFLLFPLRVAYQAFDDSAREKLWLVALMKRVAELSGWEIGRNIGSDAVVGR